jgi:uncharacterized membrane protein YdbT with pleckstrin-like domain
VPYPRHLINEGETVALDLRPHWWYFSRHILSGIPLFILLILATRIHDNTLHDATVLLLGVAAIAWAVWLASQYVTWTRTYFVVTSDRVIYRTGVFSRHGVEIPLDRVNNINFHQSLWERIIGAGNLEIQSAGEEGTSAFDDVRHPDGVQQEIYRRMEERARRTSGKDADAIGDAVGRAMGGRHDAGGASIPAQISELAQLRDRGVITPDEFERKKRELLERM